MLLLEVQRLTSAWIIREFFMLLMKLTLMWMAATLVSVHLLAVLALENSVLRKR